MLLREALATLWRHRLLIARLAKREISARYRGSILGPLWAIALPLTMIAIYTIVFSGIFKSRWPVPPGGDPLPFALVLFGGLAVFNLFAEVVNASPGLIRANPTYVKQVVFPLEILPAVSLAVAGFTTTIAVAVVLVAHLILRGIPPITALWLPLIVLPVPFFALGIAWFLSSIGTFLRDVTHIAAPLTTILMFLSPIFYPLDSVPEGIRPLILANPMTTIVAQSRGALFFSEPPAALPLAICFFASLVAFIAGYWWFRRTKDAFADVI